MLKKYEISNPVIDIERALFILQKENIIANKRNYQSNKIYCIYIHSKDISKTANNFIYIARKGRNFDGYILVKDVLESGNIFMGEKKHLLNLSKQNKLDEKYLESVLVHPHFIEIKNAELAINLLLEAAFDIQHEKFKTIGVTGTNGKTSVTQITGQILEKLYQQDVLKIGTLGMQIGDNIFPVSHATTPDYPSFLSVLNSAQKNNVTKVVMEVTSHGLKEKRLFHWLFDIAIFTNLTQDHLDYHETMDDYRDSKSLLFTSHLNKNGTAVICVNNDEWEFFCEQAQGKSRNIIGVGHKNKEQDFFKKCGNNWSDIYFLSLTPKESTLKGISGTLALAGKKNLISKADFCSPLLGDFQFENILCAVGATLASGFTLNQITPILSELKNIPGRLEKVLLPPHLSAAPIILVDYSHTPDSLEKALHTCKKALTTAGKGKLLCVFGCGGDRDRTKRPIMGKIASEICDLVVITSDNPRTEDPDAIIDEIFTGISKQNCLREQDRKKAIEVAIRCANSDDLIIIAGKGHEDYQIIGATKFPFSDAKVARLILLDAIQ